MGFRFVARGGALWGERMDRIAEILAKVKRQCPKPFVGSEPERTPDGEPSIHAESIVFLEQTDQEPAAC